MSSFVSACRKPLTRRYGQEVQTGGLFDLFGAGRNKSTMGQYSYSYQRWMKYLLEKALIARQWDTVVLCSYLSILETSHAGEVAVKKFCVMFGILADNEEKERLTMEKSHMIRIMYKSR